MTTPQIAIQTGKQIHRCPLFQKVICIESRFQGLFKGISRRIIDEINEVDEVAPVVQATIVL